MQQFKTKLDELSEKSQLRSLPKIKHYGRYIKQIDGLDDSDLMLNLSGNDYLGFGSNLELNNEFYQWLEKNDYTANLGSGGSRLLTGNFSIFNDLEDLIAQKFNAKSKGKIEKKALLFNSGYHANIGILPAICSKNSLVIADKLVHASIIDGIRLADCDFLRYRHNDYDQLTNILDKIKTDDKKYQRIIIVTESLFSMDGDFADLAKLVMLKHQFDTLNIMLYVDEAHALGVFGSTGLGLCEQFDCIADIDFIIGTFGKAFASQGAYVVCNEIIKKYLINSMRPLIFSTAMAPISVYWNFFLFKNIHKFSPERAHLQNLAQSLKSAIEKLTNTKSNSNSHIVPLILGDNKLTLKTAQNLQQQGFYCLPIRPPTVPNNSSRIRFSLTADITKTELAKLLDFLKIQVKE